MIRNGLQIVGKIEEELFKKKDNKTKTGLGIILGAKKDDLKQNQWRKFDQLKKQIINGKLDLKKLQKVAEYLETTIEDLMITQENTNTFNNISNSNAVGNNNSVSIETGSSENLSMEEKIDILFKKAFNE